LNHSLHILKGHSDDVLQLSWSPHHEAILATASNDRRIFVWDLACIGQTEGMTDLEDGPPELLVKMETFHHLLL
jgi:WD40 repeat protein